MEKKEKGSGTNITIDLSDHADLIKKIREAAEADDRPPSVWLRRKLISLGDKLFQ